jgi:quercetin dioxygenase-like cupin family protein
MDSPSGQKQNKAVRPELAQMMRGDTSLRGRIVRTSDLHFEEHPERGNSQAWPTKELGAVTMSIHLSDIPAAKKTAYHRHTSEAVIYIVDGEGHTEVEGEQLNWRTGDLVYVPPLAWHQHANHDPERPARYLACTNLALVNLLGLFVNEERPIT